jgi:hypothetical protein
MLAGNYQFDASDAQRIFEQFFGMGGFGGLGGMMGGGRGGRTRVFSTMGGRPGKQCVECDPMLVPGNCGPPMNISHIGLLH